MHWSPLPLTIKAGRAFARELDLQPEPQIPSEKAGISTGRTPALAVKNVWFAYNGHDALAGVSCDFQPGQIVALMGRNGSGKTTLLKNMVGLLRPQQGRVEVEGQDTSALKVQAIARKVGYVPQNPDALALLGHGG